MSDRIGSSAGRSDLDLGLALLAGDEVVDHAAAQRAGAVQRVERDQVVEPLRLRLAQDVAHAAALELEDAERLSVLENLVGLGIVERNGVDVELDAGGPLDLGDRVEDQRQRAQPQEVHLEEPDPLDLLHRPLGHDFVAGPFVERRVFSVIAFGAITTPAACTEA